MVINDWAPYAQQFSLLLAGDLCSTGSPDYYAENIMPHPKLVTHVYELHRDLFRELNDLHIFSSYTLPLLDQMATKYRSIESTSDKSFIVPGRIGKAAGIAKRTPQEVAELFERFVHGELHANLLLVCVSRFESFLNDILRGFLQTFPEKLAVGFKGGESAKQISISVVLDAATIEEARETIVESRLQGAFYADPKEYLSYFENIAGVKIPERLFASFTEIKATRDIIIHNDGKINALYLRKSGKLARGKMGDRIQLTDNYFKHCISTMKSISSEIEKKTRATHADSNS